MVCPLSTFFNIPTRCGGPRLSWGEGPLPYRYRNHLYHHPDTRWCRPSQRNVPVAVAVRFEPAEMVGEVTGQFPRGPGG